MQPGRTHPNGATATLEPPVDPAIISPELGIAEPALPPAPPPRPALEPPRERARLGFRLLAALAVVLALILGVGALYGKTLLDDRDATNAGLREQIATLSAERDGLTGRLAQLSAERDGLTGQVSDLQRQLSQARGDASREQGLADRMETLAGNLRTIVDLDTQIQNEFANVTYYLASSMNNYLNGAYDASLSDLDQANAAFDRLDPLLTQRDDLLTQVDQ